MYLCIISFFPSSSTSKKKIDMTPIKLTDSKKIGESCFRTISSSSEMTHSWVDYHSGKPMPDSPSNIPQTPNSPKKDASIVLNSKSGSMVIGTNNTGNMSVEIKNGSVTENDNEFSHGKKVTSHDRDGSKHKKKKSKKRRKHQLPPSTPTKKKCKKKKEKRKKNFRNS